MTLKSFLLLCIALVISIIACKKDDPPPAPLFDIDVKVASSLNPAAAKIRVALFYDRSTYDLEKSKNPSGNPFARESGASSYAFYAAPDASGLAAFKDLRLNPILIKGNNVYVYDTLFVRVEAMQLIGKDSVFKSNDANISFLTFSTDLAGQTRVFRSIDVLLK